MFINPILEDLGGQGEEGGPGQPGEHPGLPEQERDQHPGGPPQEL